MISFPTPPSPLKAQKTIQTTLDLGRWEVLEHWSASLSAAEDGRLLVTDPAQWNYSAQWEPLAPPKPGKWCWFCVEGSLLEGALSAGWWSEDGEKEARCDTPGEFALFVPLPSSKTTTVILRNAFGDGETKAVLKRVSLVEQPAVDRLTPVMEASSASLQSEGVRHQLLPVLSEQECGEWTQQVLSLREHWTQRAVTPFYTLGYASYLDMFQRPAAYRAEAATNNAFLTRHFGALLERVEGALSEALGDPVECRDGLAWPGFHIFEADPSFAREHARRHFDLQYVHHPWPKEAELSSPLSFTLSLALPAGGAGLRLWPIEKSATSAVTPPLSLEEFVALQDFADYEERGYEVGTLVIHSGHQLHQIGPFEAKADKQELRLTLQGHGIRVKGRWQLYW